MAFLYPALGPHARAIMSKAILDRSDSRLRYLFKFHNEEKLFQDVHNETEFSVAVYGSSQVNPYAHVIMSLFHPKTVDDCFESSDESIAEGKKDENGKWNHKGQKDRLITLNKNALEDIGRVFADSLTAPVLPDIHCESLLKVIQKFAHVTTRVRDLGDDNYCISSMWNETTSRKYDTIAEFSQLQTKTPASFEKLILNGPHINVGNPFFKTPNNPCKSNKDWIPIDLELIPDDYVPRCKYEQKCDDTTYATRQATCKWDQKVFDQHWRVAYRTFVGTDSERTLTGSLIPPDVGHVDINRATIYYT